MFIVVEDKRQHLSLWMLKTKTIPEFADAEDKDST